MQFGDMVQPGVNAHIRAPPQPYSFTRLNLDFVSMEFVYAICLTLY